MFSGYTTCHLLSRLIFSYYSAVKHLQVWRFPAAFSEILFIFFINTAFQGAVSELLSAHTVSSSVCIPTTASYSIIPLTFGSNFTTSITISFLCRNSIFVSYLSSVYFCKISHESLTRKQGRNITARLPYLSVCELHRYYQLLKKKDLSVIISICLIHSDLWTAGLTTELIPHEITQC